MPSSAFGGLVGQPALVASEFAYGKDEEIFGEGEPSEYVYQVVSGAVRSYKLLSLAVVRSVPSLCRATCSGLNPAPPIVSGPKRSITPGCAW